MKMSRLVCLGSFLGLLFCGMTAAAERSPRKPVALVYALTGKATLIVSATGRRPLRLFDRLTAGEVVDVGPGSRVALAFENGRRYELRERSRATLGPADLSARSGAVSSLRTVPPLPRLLPIAEKDRPGLRAGAVRIRAERITSLYPDRGAATLAGATLLRFEAVEGGGNYRVEVYDRQGNVIFAEETAASHVSIPAGLLQPGMRYDWTVRTVGRVGPIARGEAGFVTLPSRLAEQREALRRAVETSGDGALLALLAEMDKTLGLWHEAREGLVAALAKSPGNAALAEELAALSYLQSP